MGGEVNVERLRALIACEGTGGSDDRTKSGTRAPGSSGERPAIVGATANRPSRPAGASPDPSPTGPGDGAYPDGRQPGAPCRHSRSRGRSSRLESDTTQAIPGDIRVFPGKPENRRMGSAKSGPIGTNQKHLLKSIGYLSVSITLTCYLCNTRPKTREMRPFQAVPLLRVQGRSVIVVARRRGASRSRPV